jgi:heme o synthase
MRRGPLLSPASVSAVPRGSALDYVALIKLRLVGLVLFTTGIGFLVGLPGEFGRLAVMRLIHTIIATGLVACGAMALNQVVERDSDALMQRTCRRPVPEGRVGVLEAYLFGLLLASSGVVYLLAVVSSLAAGLAVLTCVTYLLAYTPLKRVTTLNTIVGAVSGAIPPVIGYAAAADHLAIAAWALFGILFVWQIPHFLGIAWMYRDDYARAGLMMLPVVDRSGRMTSRQIVLFSLTLLLVSLMPTVAGVAGPFYFTAALALGLAFVICTLALLVTRDRRSARQVFLASVIYLPLLLTVLLVDRS